ncbi:small G protein signaling modulator 3 homolog isoform X2 [Daktulosphaira vitifoliae]|uniref:small G protein signaling modulator 3 homolog isoform X2 n=1 Tax=Daktulosphaira vitifoliae TaxID=58002 RepID=UPI0021AA0E22|nr:small G protein signaling modulator 3 homolog isoform X2 [Daktulosphaira vitifoliae]
MDLKKLFLSRSHEGYVGKENHTCIESAIETEDEEETESSVYTQFIKLIRVNNMNDWGSNIKLTKGKSFSGLTPSMWPEDILDSYIQHDNKLPYQPLNQQWFDEFGFRNDITNEYLDDDEYEDSHQRTLWISYLESYYKNKVIDSKNNSLKPYTNKLRFMVRQGIPHSLRPQLWMIFSGAFLKKQTHSISYKEIVRSSNNDTLVSSKQIEKDLLRTMPSHVCFNNFRSIGIPRLRRVLRSLAWLYPDIGYCQGTSMIVASLLLILEEEESFWMMCTIVEDLLPAMYYTTSLIGVKADQQVLKTVLGNYLPDVCELLQLHDIELSLITVNWFLTLFSNVVNFKVLLRIWDLLFYEGSIILFQITIGLLKSKETILKTLDNSADIFNALSNIPGNINSVKDLFYISFELCPEMTNESIETYRRRYLGYLMADGGALIPTVESSVNLTKHLNRQAQKSKSLMQSLLFGYDTIEDTNKCTVKCKNIRQTEFLIDLREAIMQVARHFVITDTKLSNVSLKPDFTKESHSKDLEAFVNVSQNKKRRAKALLDFERHDDDELGFRKNDILTIICRKDEHCWIGELNGLKGWFPAKFVELLDERSKQYSVAGDDSISEIITDLVRGSLCSAIKQVLEHGIKRPYFLGGPCHPWLFIEEVAITEVERDYSSVYSRLMLCKTYRLDEDGKVLTPEELLYRCIQSINQSHDITGCQMDVKLRSLICLGLNEQALHLWLELLCCSDQIVKKWYHPWSFMYSPGWVQVKCELRVLSQFPFNLNPDWELPPKKENNVTLKAGVRDMLVKHHLFSWDL